VYYSNQPQQRQRQQQCKVSRSSQLTRVYSSNKQTMTTTRTATLQLARHEDQLFGCPFLARVVGASATFATPIVNASTGQVQATLRTVLAVTAFCPLGRVLDRCGHGPSAGGSRRIRGGGGGGSVELPEVTDDQVVGWARDAAAGLRALHAKGLTHRNLNPGNVHLDARGRAVLTGFQVLSNPRAPGDPYSLGRADCGTPAILAPEVDDGFPVSPAADVWALGCCLLAWTTGRGVVKGAPSLHAVRDAPTEALLRAVPRRFGARVRSALRMCLQHHPAKRATAADLWKLLATSGK